MKFLRGAELRIEVGGALRVFEGSQAVQNSFEFGFFGWRVRVLERVATSVKKPLG